MLETHEAHYRVKFYEMVDERYLVHLSGENVFIRNVLNCNTEPFSIHLEECL